MTIIQSEGSVLGVNRAPWAYNTPRISTGLTDYAGRVQTYADIYRTQPNVRLVVRFLARNISSLELGAYRRISKSEREELLPPLELPSIIQRPNPRTSRRRMIRALVEDLKIYDDAYLVALRNPETNRLRLFRIPPPYIRPYNDPADSASSWLFADFYEIFGSAGRTLLPQEQVIHLHGHNPDDSRRGLSPLEALRRILAEEAASGEWREQYWTGAARMGGVIERPKESGRWSETAQKRFQDGWVNAYKGNGGLAGTTPILEDGMIFHPTTFNPQESEYLSGRKLSREEVAAAYFIPPAFVGILENANFSNMEEQHISLYADTLGPDLDDIEEDFELQLLPLLQDVDLERDYVEFDLEQKLNGSFEKQAIAASTAVGGPWITRNEMRAKRNLAPVPGGDLLIVPLNVLEGGLASPRDTAPPLALPAGGQASRGQKSAAQILRAEATKREIRKWDVKHRDALEAFFFRQKAAVIAGLGAGKTVAEAFAGADPERWDRELKADLLGVAFAMNEDIGALSADRFGQTYDPVRAAAWLDTNARIAAENINTATRSALALAFAGAKARRAGRKATVDDLRDELGADEYDLDFEDFSDEAIDNGLADPLDAAKAVFDLAIAARAVQAATSRSTGVGNFSLQDGAKQAGAGSKTWVVTSANSRHPELDGETVAIGESFSNGGDWPGDATLDVEEVAGCECLLDFNPPE